MSAAEGADFLADNLLSPRPITDDDLDRFQSEPELIDWPLTRAQGRIILDALLALHPCELTDEETGVDALIEYAAEYWGECDDAGQPWEPCS